MNKKKYMKPAIETVIFEGESSLMSISEDTGGAGNEEYVEFEAQEFSFSDVNSGFWEE